MKCGLLVFDVLDGVFERGMMMSVLVGVIMGFKLDWSIFSYIVDMLDKLGIFYEVKVVFVYCILDLFFQYVEEVEGCGFEVIIVGVGGVVYLLGMCVVKIYLLVFGVLVQLLMLLGVDLLFFIVQMFVGVLVVILVIGKVGVVNVVLFLVSIFGVKYLQYYEVLKQFCVNQIEIVLDNFDLCDV